MTKILKLKLPALILSAATLITFQASAAKPSINEMQTCQGLIDFVTLKLDNLPAKYNEDDVEIVQKGLRAYNKYIQKTFVNPGLLKFSNGNQNKADGLQKKVDVYKASVVKSYQNQYPYNKLSRGFVESLNKCTRKAVPAGNDLESLKTSFVKMLELIKKQ
ncbi:MAG: hypothetical protein HRT35_01090 [Algicola sp.]|nr:hypothetical protein [Algicola sp.]